MPVAGQDRPRGTAFAAYGAPKTLQGSCTLFDLFNLRAALCTCGLTIGQILSLEQVGFFQVCVFEPAHLTFSGPYNQNTSIPLQHQVLFYDGTVTRTAA